ncbi:MAG: methyltransferase domain-containing protein [Actinomycetes bacterium]
MAAYESVLRSGSEFWVSAPDGRLLALPVQRWLDDASPCDDAMLDLCAGPTLDIGCGPGRLTRALTDRGIEALGVDLSREAIRLAVSRGIPAMQADVFAELPREGSWASVLLADGNIGIGGDPARLLRRCADLVTREGSVIVEVDPPGSGVTRGRVHVTADGLQGWMPWATVAADALPAIAEDASLSIRTSTVTPTGRHMAELVPERPNA